MKYRRVEQIQIRVEYGSGSLISDNVLTQYTLIAHRHKFLKNQCFSLMRLLFTSTIRHKQWTFRDQGNKTTFYTRRVDSFTHRSTVGRLTTTYTQNKQKYFYETQTFGEAEIDHTGCKSTEQLSNKDAIKSQNKQRFPSD